MEASDKNITTKHSVALVISIFIAGLCSIVYELLIATVSSYFLGNSVVQFSITIGVYMAALGLGAYLSRLVKGNVYRFFVGMEILLGAIGGLSIPILYATYALAPELFQICSVVLTLIIGVLVGYEIPLLTRLLEKFYALKVNISNVLTLDYAGALLATLLFPFVLLPLLGPFRSSLVLGLTNMLIGYLVLIRFSDRFETRERKRMLICSSGVVAVLATVLIASQTLVGIWSQNLYSDRIIFQKRSSYQEIVMTLRNDDLRLFLNGNLQFAARDEYRYHEALAFPPLSAHGNPENVLLLGGGDGLLTRELLKDKRVKSVTLVDLDPAVTEIAQKHGRLRALNEGSLSDPRVTVIHADAFKWLAQTEERFDIIYSDLPDPNDVSLARFYTREFYSLIRSRLRPEGIFTAQATSPYFARDTFWQIVQAIRASQFEHVLPYHANVPSFGTWGFVMASSRNLEELNYSFPQGLCYVTAENWSAMRHFTPDTDEPSGLKLSTLDRPRVLHSYLRNVYSWR